MRSELDDLLWLGALVLAARAWEEWMSSSPAQALQQGGARIYDFVHDDAGHKRDLPQKPWKIDRIVDLAADLKFPNPELAAAIAMAESGGVPNGLTLTDREESVGLWQINLRAHDRFTREEMEDPLLNAKAAFEISRGGTDWGPWSVWWEDADRRIGPGRGRFLNFMP